MRRDAILGGHGPIGIVLRLRHPAPAGRAGARLGKRLSPELEAGLPVAAVYDRRTGFASAVIDRRYRIPSGLSVIPRGQEV